MFDSYLIGADGYAHIDKDPGAILPYGLDLGPWLLSKGETGLASCTCTADAGVTAVGPVVITAGKLTQITSGGTLNGKYKLVFHFVTVPGGYEDERTIVLDVKQR